MDKTISRRTLIQFGTVASLGRRHGPAQALEASNLKSNFPSPNGARV